MKNIEHLFVKIHVGNEELIIGSTYVPPSSKSSIYTDHMAEVSIVMMKNSPCKFLFFGDYNVPSTSWMYGDIISPTFHHYVEPELRLAANILSSNFAFYNMTPVFPNHPKKGYTLDLLFTSIKDITSHITEDSITPCDKHHISTLFEIQIDERNQQVKQDYFSRNFYKADYTSIKSELSDIDWCKLLSDKQLDECMDIFYNKINNCVVKYVPFTVKNRNSYPTWYNAKLIKLIEQKMLAHKTWKHSNNIRDYNEFKRIRAMVMRKSKYLYKEYITNVEFNIFKNVKCFWNHVNNLRKNKSNISHIEYLNYSSSNNITIANVFANYFKSTYSSDCYDASMDMDDYNLCNLDASISVQEIYNAIKNLKISGSPGPDGIPSIFIKNLAEQLLTPLNYLFNKSITGKFPDKWKLSFVTPIFKGGNQNLASNYRPISIGSAIPKLLDAIMANKILDYFCASITAHQHGFVKGR